MDMKLTALQMAAEQRALETYLASLRARIPVPSEAPPSPGRGAPGVPKTPEHKRKIAAAMVGNTNAVRLNARGALRPRKFHKVTLEAVRQFRDLRESGKTLAEISDETGFPVSTVGMVLQKFNIKPKVPIEPKAAQRRPMTADERIRAHAMYKNGIGIREIARQLHRSQSVISRIFGRDWHVKGTIFGRLTEKDRKAIRVLAKLDYTMAEIARRTGRSSGTISWIVHEMRKNGEL